MKYFSQKFIAVLILLVLSHCASAALILNIDQVGNDVIASYSGSVNLNALIDQNTNAGFVSALESNATEFVFSVGNQNAGGALTAKTYGIPNLVFTGSLGTVSFISTASEIGDEFAFTIGPDNILLPGGYVSGDPLSGSAVFQNLNLTTLGFNLGTFSFSFGQSGITETVTVNITQSNQIPAPQALFLLLLGLPFISRRSVTKYL